MKISNIHRRLRKELLELSLTAKKSLPGNRFLFDHIPRTGGTYFAGILNEMLGAASENFNWGYEDPDIHSEEIRHLDRYPVVVGQMRLDKVTAFQKVRPRHVITLLRDPIDQIQSTYTFWRFNITEDLDHCNFAKSVSFSDFIRDPSMHSAVDNPMTRHLFCLCGPQILEHSETAVLLAKSLIDSYAFAGVTERMEDNLLALSKLFATKVPGHSFEEIDRNASKGRMTVSPEDRAFLRQTNEIDYAIYLHVNEKLDRLIGRGLRTTAQTPEPYGGRAFLG
jgi:hypothetical protein